MKLRFCCICAAAIPLGLFAVDETAQTETNVTRLNPVIVTGSPTEARSFNTPYSVDSVRVDPIANAQLGVNASEVLVGIPGVVVQNRQNFAQDLQISIRGFGARSAFGVRGVKLIADGIPASNPDGQGQVATFDLDTAERIEVLRGPFATIYGNAAGGVIQLFSRDGKGDPRVYAGVSGGSWGTTKFLTGSEGEIDGTGYVVAASRFQTDGYRQHSEATRYQEFAKVTFHPDADSQLTLVVNGLQQPHTQDPLGLTFPTFKANPRAVEQPAITFNTRKTIYQMQGGATYDRQFGDYNRLEMVGYAGDRNVTQFQAIPVSAQISPKSPGGVIVFDRDFQGVGARWIFEREIASGNLAVTAGIDFDRSEDDRQGYENFVGTTLGVKGALRRNETDVVLNTAPYLQAAWDWDKWQVSAGIRQSWVDFDVNDHYLANGDDSGTVNYNQPTPVFGLLYKVTPRLNLYGSVGSGFETPTFNELFYSPGGGGFNFGLKPSKSLQGELGVKAFVTEKTRVNADVFQINTTDEIIVASSTGGRTGYTNAPSTLRQGVEFEVESDLTSQLTAKGSFTYLHAVYDGSSANSGRHIPGVPDFTAYGELAWHPFKGITLGSETIYRSQVFVEDTNQRTPAPDNIVEDLFVAAEQTCGRWKFSEMFRVDNVFDEKYIGSVIVGDTNLRFYEPAPARSFFAGVQIGYRF